MRAWTVVLLLDLSVSSWGCSRVCRSGEAKVGDECVALVDGSVEGDADAITPDEGEDVGDAGTEDAPSGSDGAVGQLLDGGNQLADTGGSTSDAHRATPEESGTADAADVIVGPEPADGGSSNAPDGQTGDGGCSGASCIRDACHPNPCGHGACSLAGSGFSCRCEPDWKGNGVCNLNTSAALTSLTVSAGKLFPAFKSNLYEYSVDVGVGSPELTFAATARQPDGVTMRIDGESYASGATSPVLDVPLNSEARTTFEVVADDGTMTKYSVVVRRSLALQAEILFPGFKVAVSDGHGFALSDGLLATLQTGSDGRTLVSMYSRSGTNWVWKAYFGNAPGRTYRSVALNSRWLAAGAWASTKTMEGLVSIADRTQLVQLNSPASIQLSAPEERFGFDLAVLGDTLAVLSATRAHVYEFVDFAWKHVAQFDVAGGALALGDSVLAVAAEGGVKIYRRTNSTWGEAPGPGSALFGGASPTALALSGSALAAVEQYMCAFSCTDTAPILHLFDTAGASWAGVSVRTPFGANVPLRLDPNGFGVGLALAENVAITGAFFEGSLRTGVNSAVPPDVSGLPDKTSFADGWGVAYVTTKRGGNQWRLEAVLGPKVRADARLQPMAFGFRVQADRGLIAVAAQASLDQVQEAPINGGGGGAIYIFGPDCSKVPAGAEVLGC